jgi:cytochrome c oxidase subunit 3
VTTGVLEDRKGGAPPPESVPEERRGDGSGPIADPSRFGLLTFLGTISMLFIGFTSTYIVRESAADWTPLAPPPVLFLNTGVLLLSSVALERSRRLLKAWDLAGTQAWLGFTGALGALFVVGQILTWRALAHEGIFLATNIHSSFFYLLTGLHAVHLLGGLVWFVVLLVRSRSLGLTPGSDGLGLLATYWHFLAGLWLYLLYVLFVL